MIMSKDKGSTRNAKQVLFTLDILLGSFEYKFFNPL